MFDPYTKEVELVPAQVVNGGMDKPTIEEFFGVPGEELDRDLIEYEDYVSQGGTRGFLDWLHTVLPTIPCPPSSAMPPPDTIPTIPLEPDPFPY